MNKGIIITRPLCFLDLETTGVNVNEDRIVEIAIVKLFPDGVIKKTKTLINPGVTIPEGATSVHGITNEMVKDAPFFEEIAPKLLPFITNCDIAGYNSDRFDIPLLHEEFARANINFPEDDQLTVDSYLYECAIAPRDLSTVYKKYLGKELEGAHDALVDVEATLDILVSQCELKDEGVTIEEIVSAYKDPKALDWAGKLYKDEDGSVRWAFGKHKGDLLLNKDNKGYIDWFLKEPSNPNQTKRIIRQLIEEHNEKIRAASNS